MNPKIKNLLGVAAVIAAVILIALLIIWIASRFIGNDKGENKVDAPPVQSTCSNVDCSKCCANQAGACLDCSKCCDKCPKPQPKFMPRSQPSALAQCLARCDGGHGAPCFTSAEKCAVCQAACRGTTVVVKKETKTTVKEKKVIVREKEKQQPCKDCNTPDVQPNVPGKGPEPSNETGPSCPSGNCSSSNDVQPNVSGNGPEPPS